MDNKIFNPKTNRFCLKSSRAGMNLLRQQNAACIQQSPTTNIKQDSPSIEDFETPPIKKKLVELTTDIVKENKTKFKKDLTQEQTDQLLRRLLYEKLCLDKKEKSKGKGKGKCETKKKKFKVKTPPPSSSEDSEDDEDDESESE